MPDLAKTVDTYARYIERLESDNKFLKEEVKRLREENKKLREQNETPEQPESLTPEEPDRDELD